MLTQGPARPVDKYIFDEQQVLRPSLECLADELSLSAARADPVVHVLGPRDRPSIRLDRIASFRTKKSPFSQSHQISAFSRLCTRAHKMSALEGQGGDPAGANELPSVELMIRNPAASALPLLFHYSN